MSGKFTYNINIAINKVLSQTERDRLMSALSKAVKDVLGTPEKGLILIYSEPKTILEIVPKQKGEEMTTQIQ